MFLPFFHHQQGRIDFNTVNPSLSREGFSDPLPVERLMTKECPYSIKTRKVLGNPSPPPLIFPMTFEVSLGNSLGSQEISRASGMDFPILPEFWWSTDILFIINPIPRDGSGNPSLWTGKD